MYRQGYDDCFYQFSKIVKKLGKKHYKEFLLEVKRKNSRFYNSSSTISTHKCNCEHCDLKN